MADEKFDIAAARAEQKELKRRARELDRQITKHMRQSLTNLLTGVAQVRDLEALQAAVREFEQREQ